MFFKIFHVDAFSEKPFKGNPAKVCILDCDLDDALMQSFAAEMNLSETAFVRPLDKMNIKKANQFSLRWFTPKTEVPLCGHATLATAKVLFDLLKNENPKLEFLTKSGSLFVEKKDEWLIMDFPIDTIKFIPKPQKLLKVLNLSKEKVIQAFLAHNTKNLILHLSEPVDLIDIRPDFTKLQELKIKGMESLVLTAQPISELDTAYHKYDFLSRCFAPWEGVNEDPVTGSTHTALAVYWSQLLCKTDLLAYQCSQRGGILKLQLTDKGRLEIFGKAYLLSEGVVFI